MPSSSLPTQDKLACIAIHAPKMSKKTPIYLMDGGLGTTLADKYGCIFDDSTPLWSSHLLLSKQDQEILAACQRDFVLAGVDVILSATYQINSDAIEDAGFNLAQTQQTMRDAIKIARKSFEGKPGTVVLGLGAYGAIMKPSQEYTGNYNKANNVAALRNFHNNRIFHFLPTKSPLCENKEGLRVFHEGHYCWSNIDMVAFETIPRLEEVIALRDVMADTENEILQRHGDVHDKKKKFWISCVFPGEGYCLPDGSTVLQVISAMLGKRAGAETPMGVGINCTKIEKIEALIEQYEAAIKILIKSGEVQEWPSLVVYPDGTNGEVYNTTTHTWETSEKGPCSQSWDEMVYDIVKRTQSRGDWKSIYVGGCCKTTPIAIAKLRMRLDQI